MSSKNDGDTRVPARASDLRGARRRAIITVIAFALLGAGFVARSQTIAGAATPSTVVTIGFDDGFGSQAQVGPMLSERGLNATFFVNTAQIGVGGYMSWAQLDGLAAGGNEIGGHTLDHVNLTTVPTEEVTREVCDDRAALQAHGFAAENFAYPYGKANATVAEIVKNCGYASARLASGLGCNGCPYAEPVPPGDMYNIRAAYSVETTMTLDTLKRQVTDAEASGGGWVNLVFHYVCDNACNQYSITPSNLAAFLDWLAARKDSGTVTKTTSEVLTGSPITTTTTTMPPSGVNLLQNPSMEFDTDTNGIPDCWDHYKFGTNTPVWTRTNDAHSGSWAENLTFSEYTNGDAKSLPRLFNCAPAIDPTHAFRLSQWYKGSGAFAFTIYTRNPLGEWTFCQELSELPPAAGWTLGAVNWQQPQTSSYCGKDIGYVPTALSFGLTLHSQGSLTVDDASLVDLSAIPPASSTTTTTVKPTTTTTRATTTTTTTTTIRRDTTAPRTTIRCNNSTSCGSVFRRSVSVSLSATDNPGGSGVQTIRYTTNGSTPSLTNGITYTAPFTITSSKTVRFAAWDKAGNKESMQSQFIFLLGF